jgi:hypothetical protein
MTLLGATVSCVRALYITGMIQAHYSVRRRLVQRQTKARQLIDTLTDCISLKKQCVSWTSERLLLQCVVNMGRALSHRLMRCTVQRQMQGEKLVWKREEQCVLENNFGIAIFAGERGTNVHDSVVKQLAEQSTALTLALQTAATNCI